MPRPKQLPALERLRIKLEAMGYTFKPEYIQKLRGQFRNANWWQNIPRDSPIEDCMSQRFCSWHTVAALAKDGVEIEVIDIATWLHLDIKKAKGSK